MIGPRAGVAIDNFADLPDEERDPHWYKRAVFYEVLVRSFKDSNGDGTGDLMGLTDKLDYLDWLGVDCIWLPPFFRSPLRDGGYDVSDFTDVLPEFGTLGDFVEFVDAAHARGIRVIIDFVMNHTSDQHPWFQSSRTDPDGPFGDFYVWADTDEAYSDARIIFVDTETSNWTFDPVRKQYFWHRFFGHQPDLNFENERVQDAIVEALKFWLDMGIDGFRLDAVPYLYEKEGTNCENLQPTHDFLKRVRKTVDEEYPDRVLLAEANQWPADVVEYFGDGDECHMAFHFPVMPRIFTGVRRESRFPLSEIGNRCSRRTAMNNRGMTGKWKAIWHSSPSAPKYSTTSLGHWFASHSSTRSGYCASTSLRTRLRNSWVRGRFSQLVPSSSNR